MKNKRLIVHAHDFGWTRGIADGILLAYRRGIVTRTLLMVNPPATPTRSGLASARRLSVGIPGICAIELMAHSQL